MLGFPRAEGQSSPDPKLVDGAKKQGEMVFYTTMTLDQSKEVVDRFQEKYPFIKPPLFRTGAAHGPGLCFSDYDCGQSSHPNARLYYDFILSKEGPEMLRGMQRIPVRKDVAPNPPRLFRGCKRVVENPEEYTDFECLVRLYNDIFKLP